MFLVFQLGFTFTALYIWWRSYCASKRGGFYTDTPWLFPLGIFVWGDGLILGGFWFMASFLFFFLQPVTILQFWLLFYAVRSSYEVVYWINHQVAQRQYEPPLFRNVSWLKPNEAAILYQLLNMAQVIICLAALGVTVK